MLESCALLVGKKNLYYLHLYLYLYYLYLYIYTQRDVCTPMFIRALFTIV